MKSLTARILFLTVIVLMLVGAAAIIWHGRQRHVGYFTDADTIRRPLADASPRDVLWQPARELAAVINTGVDEYEPRLAADGTMLFFVRGRAGENADVYFSARTPEGWDEPRPLVEVNTSADELGPEPSADGRSLYFYSDRPGGFGGYDLWVSHRREGAWQEPINLGAQVNGGHNEYGAALTPDGRLLYFASNRPQPSDTVAPDPDAWPATVREDLYRRDYDLYSAPITDRGMGAAQPVSELNSGYNDGSPAVSSVGDFLYFTSDRPGGEGGFDIYRSRRLRGQHLEAENVGPAINSAANDLDPALGLGGFSLHFSSDRARGPGRPAGKWDYDLYSSTSREVFTEYETYRASIDWLSLLPYLLWLLLGLLLLLLLLLSARLLRSDLYGKLSLLARCLLASALIHTLILILLTFWGVSTSLSDWMGRPGGTRIALVSPSAGNELAAQIRGELTELDIQPAIESTSQIDAPLQPLMPLAAPAVLAVDRASITIDESPRRVEPPADAPAQALETPPPGETPQVREQAHVSIDLPMLSAPADEAEAQPVTPATLSSREPLDRASRVPVAVDSRRPSVMMDVAPSEVPVEPAETPLPPAQAARASDVPRAMEPLDPRAPSALSGPPITTEAELPPVAESASGPVSEPAPTVATPLGEAPKYAAPTPPPPVAHDAQAGFIAPARRPIEVAEAGAAAISIDAPEAPSALPTYEEDAEAPPIEPTSIAFDVPAMPEHAGSPRSEHLRTIDATTETAARVNTVPRSGEVALDDRLIDTSPIVTGAQVEDDRLADTRPREAAAPPRSFDEAQDTAGPEIDPVLLPPMALPPAAAAQAPPATETPSTIEPTVPQTTDRLRFRQPVAIRRDMAPAEVVPEAPGVPPPDASLHAMTDRSAPDAATTLAWRTAPTGPSPNVPAPPPLEANLPTVEEMDAAAASERSQDARFDPRQLNRIEDAATPGHQLRAPDVHPSPETDEWIAEGDAAESLFRSMAPGADASLVARPALVESERPAVVAPLELNLHLPAHPFQELLDRRELSSTEIWGAVRGVVTDAATGRPLPGATVRLDLTDVPAVTAVTGESGEYLLLVPEVPDFVALSASMERFTPETVNIAADELEGAIVTRDFQLTPQRRDIIVIEAEPDVHHLGDDMFTGRINSQFQKRSEGRRFTAAFELSPGQIPPDDVDAEIQLLVRGAQRNNRIRVNDELVETRLSESPRDGSFGAFETMFPASWLREGMNTIEIRSVHDGSDFDDFEFVNVRIRLPDLGLHPVNPYPQRSEERRHELVEEMGGSRETERAVALALDWLARHQSADGRWDSDAFDDACGQCGGPSRAEVDIATTGLSLLCFLATNHTHVDDGPYRDTVRRAIEWLVRQQGAGGSLLGEETMYSHGIATIALAEAFGMTGDGRLQRPVQRAVDFIIAAANRRIGGWRYAPGQVGDTSVLGWQIMALTSAQRAGLDVPEEGFDIARRWLQLVASSPEEGLYAYQPDDEPSPAMTAEGMFVAQLLGATSAEASMQASADYLLANPPDWDVDANTYYWYYATLALFQHQGEAWRRWNEAVKDELLAHQSTSGAATGSWAPDDQWAHVGGRVYQTAICTLTLEVYYRYLPLYMREGP